MTAQEFLTLSSELVNDMKTWIAEAAKDETLSASDLALLNASMKVIVERTVQEASHKPETPN